MASIKKTTTARKRKVTTKGKLPFLVLAKKFCALVLSFAIIAPQAVLPLAVLAQTAPAANPVLPQNCGLDVVLVLDNSTSIDETEIQQEKGAFIDLVDSLAGTPTEFAVVQFGTRAEVKGSFTNDIDQTKSAINAVAYNSYAATNWQDALLQVHSILPNRDCKNNLVIFASDGDPTINNEDLDSQNMPINGNNWAVSDPVDLEKAVIAANTIKNSGTRMITLGIGSAVTQSRMEAISSADAYYPVSDFGALAQVLQDLATSLCGGTITVSKFVGDGDEANWVAAGSGWEFNIGGQAGKLTDENGQTEAVSLLNGTSYSVVETQKSGYELANATCSISNDGQNPLGTLDLGNNQITDIDITTDDIVSCSFYNRLLPYCGDGMVDPGEECDDGNNADGDGCSATCENEPPAPGCGDGTVDPGEECDDGSANGMVCQPDYDTCNYCSGVCTLVTVQGPYCGDGNVDTPYEQCDDGDNDDGDGCSATCRVEILPPQCGNGVVENGEECDDGNTVNGDGCSMNCTIETQSPVCGNGILENGEGCDDGNTDDGDGCSALCQTETSSIDGVCGAANGKTYPWDATGFDSDTFCEIGAADPSSVAFPAVGDSVDWTCLGQNNGNDAICAASRDIQPSGCTDPAASNYDSSAVGDDGSCQYPQSPTSGGGISGQYMPGYGPNAGGITPQVAGASIDLDDIQRQINEIRNQVNDLASQILGSATTVSTGVCASLPQDGDYGDNLEMAQFYAKIRAKFCLPELITPPQNPKN